MKRTRWLAIPCLLAGFALSARAAPGGEQALRELDAAWVRAAQSGSVDAWMSFYANDALVLPPNEAAVSERGAIARSIAALLSLPGLKIAWQPTRIELSASSDLAALAGTYSLQYRDATGVIVADRGKLLEVWRRQADGGWKCVIDTWNSDLPAPQAVPAAAPASGAPPAAIAPPRTVAGATAPPPTADYGDAPQNYEATIRSYFRHVLGNPESAHYGAVSRPEHGSLLNDGLFIRHPGPVYGWIVSATVDAQTSWGSYTGPKTYTFLFRGEKLVRSIAPPSEGEMK